MKENSFRARGRCSNEPRFDVIAPVYVHDRLWNRAIKNTCFCLNSPLYCSLMLLALLQQPWGLVLSKLQGNNLRLRLNVRISLDFDAIFSGKPLPFATNLPILCAVNPGIIHSILNTRGIRGWYHLDGVTSSTYSSTGGNIAWRTLEVLRY